MQPAAYGSALPDGRVQCGLCPHGCQIAEGGDGLCRVRGVRGGGLQALGYGQVSSAHLDPVEKKPLYHFQPGRAIFSVGGWGCNFGCAFCQNWTLSQQALLEGETVAPVAPAAIASRARAAGSVGIAYTYNEPLVGYEFVRDCARLVRAAGAANVLVTNGYVQPGPAAELLPLIDAANVDIKSMDDGFYRTHCHGRLAPVLAFCEQAAQAGCHVEITNLLIPGLNDGDGQVRELARWVSGHLGAATPLHLSAYHPDYRLDVAATTLEALVRAHALCREELAYVYIGNALTDVGRDTICPGCGDALVRREGYRATVCGVRDGACARCGRAADLVL